MTKLKQGRMWFIKTPLPLPLRDALSINPKTAAKVLAGSLSAFAGPAALAVAGLFEDVIEKHSDELLARKNPYKVESPNRKPPYGQRQPVFVFLKCGMELYHKQGEEPPIGWAWVNNPQTATPFETREEAETEAFNFIAQCPWFMGKLSIVKIKLGRPE